MQLSRIISFIQNRHFFGALALLIVAMEVIALFYQYSLDYEPCVLCIHVRVWLVPLLVCSVLAWIVKNNLAVRIIVLCMMVTELILVERSWQLLATERGWGQGSCSLDLGFPNWFQPDVWIPWMFEARDLCGYTPVMPLNISMAEFLLAFWVLAAGLTTCHLFPVARKNQQAS